MIAIAVQELQTITKVSLGYHARSPRKERIRAQRQYLRWWQAEGRELFVRE